MDAIGLDNRLAATWVAAALFVVASFSFRDSREQTLDMLRMRVSWKLSLQLILLTLLSALVVGATCALGWWSRSLAAVVLTWFVTFVFAGYFDLSKVSSGVLPFRSVLLPVLGVGALTLAVFGLFVYPLGVEIVFAVLLLAAKLLLRVAGKIPVEVRKPAVYVLFGLVGVIFALEGGRVLAGLTLHWSEIEWGARGSQIAIPIAYAFLLLPALYVLAVWVNIEGALFHIGLDNPPSVRRQGAAALLLESRGRLGALTHLPEMDRIPYYNAMGKASTRTEAREIFREQMNLNQ